MCGRFALTIPGKEFVDMHPGITFSFWPAPRYNIAPGQDIATILNTEPSIVTATRWGLIPSWSQSESIGYRMINARVETIHEKPSFKGLFRNRRCLIPSSGFFEWKKDPSSKKSEPYFIQLATSPFFFMAGLWDTWKSPDNTIIISSTIITTESNSAISNIHHRMPLILKPESFSTWLSEFPISHFDLFDTMKCYNNTDFSYHRISPLINNASYDKPDIINIL